MKNTYRFDKFSDAAGIKIGDVVSITGFGGKTSLMFLLCQECRHNHVLLTTTTKIAMPDESAYKCLYVGTPDKIINVPKGICVCAAYVNEENKLVGYSPDVLGSIIKNFDIVFIESDGAKMKLLKANNDTEPVIISATTKTISVINLQLIGIQASKENIHRFDIFSQTTGIKDGETLQVEHIAKLLASDKGPCKNAKGEKLLFINMIEKESDMVILQEFISSMKKYKGSNGIYFDKIIYGSIHGRFFYEYKK